MEKRQMVLLSTAIILVFLLIAALLVYRAQIGDSSTNTTGDITSASTAAINTQCLSPETAYEKINSGICVPVYESPDCFASGKVEIRC